MPKMKLDDLIIDEEQYGREQINQDAVQRYKELFEAGKEKAILVEEGTNKIIDGVHRYYAAKDANLNEVEAKYIGLGDTKFRAAEYMANRDHGVPYSKDERDRLICNLYIEDKMTQYEIADLVNLSQMRVSQILSAKISKETFEILAIQRNIQIIKDWKAGYQFKDIAPIYELTPERVGQIVREFKDKVKAVYEDNGILVGLLDSEDLREYKDILEVDLSIEILNNYDPEPLNFAPEAGDVWNFTMDRRFGKEHPGNIPARIVQEVLWQFTRPGDLIVDPMAGGGVTLDVCFDMRRRCLAYDLRPVREDVKIWDITKGFPPEVEEVDLIFLDPPYHKKKQSDFPMGSISELEKDGYLAFFGDLARECLRILVPDGKVALLMSKYINYEEPQQSIWLSDYVDIFGQAGLMPIEWIQCPLTSQQYKGYQVKSAREKKIRRVRSRDLIIFERKKSNDF